MLQEVADATQLVPGKQRSWSASHHGVKVSEAASALYIRLSTLQQGRVPSMCPHLLPLENLCMVLLQPPLKVICSMLQPCGLNSSTAQSVCGTIMACTQCIMPSIEGGVSAQYLPAGQQLQQHVFGDSSCPADMEQTCQRDQARTGARVMGGAAWRLQRWCRHVCTASVRFCKTARVL